MPDTYIYEKRNWYPHMKPRDVAIWIRFLEQFPDMYERVQYDVHVGGTPPFDPTVSEERNTDMSALYKRKIDVVGLKGDQIDIIELKPDADASAVGQLLMYRKLYVEDFAPTVAPKLIIVTDKVKPDVLAFAKEMGVFMVEV
ncbi:MAG: hypothetical protein AAB649_01645 [Patescibacteria group bacterium]|mgnify:CR=1 FL=1